MDIFHGHTAQHPWISMDMIVPLTGAPPVVSHCHLGSLTLRKDSYTQYNIRGEYPVRAVFYLVVLAKIIDTT